LYTGNADVVTRRIGLHDDAILEGVKDEIYEVELKGCLRHIGKIIRQQTLESWSTFSQVVGRRKIY